MRLQLFRTTVGHTRVAPVRHGFRHNSFSWLVDVGSIGSATMPAGEPAWIRTLFAFRAKDHVGDPTRSWLENLQSVAFDAGIDVTNCRVLGLSSPRSLGFVFNPLSVYWCLAKDGRVVCVIAEVHNTYGERHAYVVSTDERDRAETSKSLYVSPFNDTSGHYSMRMPLPDNTFDVGVTLHRPHQAPFVTRWSGVQDHRAVAVVGALFAPLVVAIRIRMHGVYLWARGLAVQPRPITHHQEPA